MTIGHNICWAPLGHLAAECPGYDVEVQLLQLAGNTDLGRRLHEHVEDDDDQLVQLEDEGGGWW